jgi:hypothetical protein
VIDLVHDGKHWTTLKITSIPLQRKEFKEVSMETEKKIAWKFLWFLVGIAAVTYILFLLVGRWSQTGKTEINKN